MAELLGSDTSNSDDADEPEEPATPTPMPTGELLPEQPARSTTPMPTAEQLLEQLGGEQLLEQLRGEQFPEPPGTPTEIDEDFDLSNPLYRPKRIGFRDKAQEHIEAASNFSKPFATLSEPAKDIRRQVCYWVYMRALDRAFPEGRPSGKHRPNIKTHLVNHGMPASYYEWLAKAAYRRESKGLERVSRVEAQLAGHFGTARPGDEKAFAVFVKHIFSLGRVFTYATAFEYYSRFCNGGGKIHFGTFDKMLRRECYGLTTMRISRSHLRKIIDAADIKEFYMRLLYVIIEHNISWDDVYNADETGFSRGTQVIDKVVIPVSARFTEMHVQVVGNNKTVLETLNATGKKSVAPFLVFSKGEVPSLEDLQRMGIPESWHIGRDYEKGWVESKTFVEYLKHFNEQTGGSEHKKILILDNCRVHKTDEVRQYATDNNIFIVELPPNATHLLQPLDVGYFSYFKRHFGDIYAQLSHKNRTRQDQKSTMVEAIKVAREYAMEKGPIGFAVSGIYPLQPFKMLEHQSNINLIYDWGKYFIEDEPTPLQHLLLGGPDDIFNVDAEILGQARALISEAVATVPPELQVHLRPNPRMPLSDNDSGALPVPSLAMQSSQDASPTKVANDLENFTEHALRHLPRRLYTYEEEEDGTVTRRLVLHSDPWADFKKAVSNATRVLRVSKRKTTHSELTAEVNSQALGEAQACVTSLQKSLETSRKKTKTAEKRADKNKEGENVATARTDVVIARTDEVISELRKITDAAAVQITELTGSLEEARCQNQELLIRNQHLVAEIQRLTTEQYWRNGYQGMGYGSQTPQNTCQTPQHTMFYNTPSSMPK